PPMVIPIFRSPVFPSLRLDKSPGRPCLERSRGATSTPGVPRRRQRPAAEVRAAMAPQPQLTFRQLAEYDDIAIDVVCDTLFGLEIYKVSPHYRSKRADRGTVIRAIRDLARTQD